MHRAGVNFQDGLCAGPRLATLGGRNGGAAGRGNSQGCRKGCEVKGETHGVDPGTGQDREYASECPTEAYEEGRFCIYRISLRNTWKLVRRVERGNEQGD